MYFLFQEAGFWPKPALLAKSDGFNSARAEAGRKVAGKWPKRSLSGVFLHPGRFCQEGRLGPPESTESGLLATLWPKACPDFTFAFLGL